MKAKKSSLISLGLIIILLFTACPEPPQDYEPSKIDADTISVESLPASGAEEQIDNINIPYYLFDILKDKIVLTGIVTMLSTFILPDNAQTETQSQIRAAATQEDFQKDFATYQHAISDKLNKIKQSHPSSTKDVTPESLNFTVELPKLELDYSNGITTKTDGITIPSFYSMFRITDTSTCTLDDLTGKATKGSLQTVINAKTLQKGTINLDSQKIIEALKVQAQIEKGDAVTEKDYTSSSIAKQLFVSSSLTLTTDDLSFLVSAEQYNELVKGFKDFIFSKENLPFTGDASLNFQTNLGGSFCNEKGIGGKLLLKLNIDTSISKLIDAADNISEKLSPAAETIQALLLSDGETIDKGTIIIMLLLSSDDSLFTEFFGPESTRKNMLTWFLNAFNDISLELTAWNDDNEETYKGKTTIETILDDKTENSSFDIERFIYCIMSAYPAVVDTIKDLLKLEYYFCRFDKPIIY